MRLLAGLCLFAAGCGGCGNSAQVTGDPDASSPPTDGGAVDGGVLPDGGTCGSVVLKGDRQPGTVVVAFDQSDSMNQKFTGTSFPKYKVASDALIAAVTPIQSELNLGAIFFPTQQNGSTSNCLPVAPISQAPPQIAVADGGAFISEWGMHFQPPWTLLLGTPLGDALNQVDAALTPAPAGKAAVVVLTDGQPNCSETLAGILVPVKSLAARGILTHVIGLPGATGASVLMAVADAGGTGNYLLPSDTMTLQNELAQIASGAVTQCVITLSPPPQDPNQVHLVVTLAASGDRVQIAQSVADGGWSLGSDGVTATLLGDTCAQAEAGAFSQVEFDYGCVSVPFQ